MKVEVPVWPEAEIIKIKILKTIPANTLLDTVKLGEKLPFEIEAGMMFTLIRLENPWGHDDPFYMILGFDIGAAHNWWKDFVEMGGAEVLAAV